MFVISEGPVVTWYIYVRLDELFGYKLDNAKVRKAQEQDQDTMSKFRGLLQRSCK